MSDKAKKLNQQQIDYIDNVTVGKMSRSAAYAKAYGYEDTPKDKRNARFAACRLVSTNVNVKAAIDAFRENALASIEDRFHAEAEETTDHYFFLMHGGNAEYGVQAQLCKDYYDRIGYKKKDQVEHSGNLQVNILDLIMERKKQAESE